MLTGQVTIVSTIPLCDLCIQPTQAIYDAATRMGPWGNLCQKHFDEVGIGLGTGRGQRLIVAGSE